MFIKVHTDDDTKETTDFRHLIPPGIIVKMQLPLREPPVGGEGATGSSAGHPGEVFVSGGEGAPGLLANAGNACLNVPGLVGLDK